jgi:hypothetical protein
LLLHGLLAGQNIVAVIEDVKRHLGGRLVDQMATDG